MINVCVHVYFKNVLKIIIIIIIQRWQKGGIKLNLVNYYYQVYVH